MKNVRCADCSWFLNNDKYRECTAPSPACINDGPRYITAEFALMPRTCDSFGIGFVSTGGGGGGIESPTPTVQE